MLQQLRDKTTGWIATAILALLMIPLAFFGMEQYLFQQNQTFVAKIEAPPKWWPSAPSWWPVTMLWQREEIDLEAFRTAFEQARQQQRATLGDDFDPREFESLDNKRSALDGLIDQAVLRMSADQAGIAVSDEQVRAMIQSMPAFQVAGRFDPQRYQLALASQVPSMTPRAFEQRVREGLQQSLAVTQVAESAFVTTSQMQRLMGLLGERRDVSLLVLPPPPVDDAPVAEAEIQAWYDTHTGDYRAPETVTIEYVDIDGADLPELPAPDEAALRARYERESARFVDPEQRLASHILVRLEPGADAAAQEAAQQQAAQLAAEARAPGADFAAIARENSDDAGSQAAGGDLGWIEPGLLPAPFEEALFALQPGEISDPVRTDSGWHVIQLRDVESGQQTSFEDARAALESEQLQADRDRRFSELIGTLIDQVLKNPTSLASAARSVDVPVQTLGPIARGQATGIAANTAVARAAFSEVLIQDQTVSDPIEIGPNHSVLIRVAEHTPERALPLSAVTDRVIADIRDERSRQAAEARADAMIASLRSGESLASLAEAEALSVQDIPNLPRGAPVPNAAATQAYFSVPSPAPGEVSPGKVSLPDGSTIVFAISKVTPGNPEDASEEERAMLRQQLAQIAGNQDAASMLQSLRERMTITVAEDRL